MSHNHVTKLDPLLSEAANSRLARQQLMNGGLLMEVEGSKVYQANQGWECEQIKSEQNVAKVTSVLELEEAMQNPECYTIFVPKQSALTLDMLSRVLARNSLDKTIFWEA